MGIGPTKTLAKLANKAAKKLSAGVLDLSDERIRSEVMATFPVTDVWGIGPASQVKLLHLGIESAGQVRDMDPKLARQLMTVVGERIIHELNGRPSIALETVAPQRKGCAVTRSFGQRVTTKIEMEQAVSSYATRSGEKLRRHNLGTDHVTVFMHTSPFADDPQRSVSMTVDIPEATNDSLQLIKAARRAVDRLWQSGFRGRPEPAWAPAALCRSRGTSCRALIAPTLSTSMPHLPARRSGSRGKATGKPSRC